MHRQLTQQVKHLLQRRMAAFAAILLAVILGTEALAEQTAESCGDNVTWTLSNGVLEIAGSGIMTNYTETARPPWYPMRDTINSVVVREGVTAIGNLAFYDCTRLVSVEIADTVAAVGDCAFAKCESLSMLTLGNGLTSIGESAFEQCSALVSVRLPDTLNSIGSRVFYRCAELSSIIVPAAVTHMGTAVFAYCSNLVWADIQGDLSILPAWTFYGCDALNSVCLPSSLTALGEYTFSKCSHLAAVDYSGTEETRLQLLEEVRRDIPDFSEFSIYGGASDTGKKVELQQQQENEIVLKKIFASDNASGIAEIRKDANELDSVELTATLENEKGWAELRTQAEQYWSSGKNAERIVLNLYLKGGMAFEAEILEILAGKNASLILHTEQGAVLAIDCAQLNGAFSDAYDLSVTVLENQEPTKEQQKVAGETGSCLISFADELDFPVKVHIPVGMEWKRHTATIFDTQFLKGYRPLQTAIVDADGCAAFPLAAVEKTEYLLTFDTGEPENAIVPQALADEYGSVETYRVTEYVVTGRNSSWGLGLKQVTWILAAVMVISVIVVGAAMWGLQHRKSRERDRLKKHRSGGTA